MAKYDLVIKGGTLLDTAAGIHAPRDVAFAEGVVAAVETKIPDSEATNVVDASGHLVVPGMIDLHVHVFEGISYLGVAPDPACLARGVTTVVDAGTSGADTFPGFRKYIIEASETRIFATLNISSQGMLSREIGELDDIQWANVSKALQCIEANRDLILGVKVRLTRDSIVSENAGLQPLYRAREAADAAGLPIMVHPQNAWCASLDDVLAVMAKGDILTHTYHGMSHGILDEAGQVRRAVRKARERGVLFDVGHGAGSFNWQVCETALAQEFPPDTISTDLHTANINGPVYDLATTISKFLHLGFTLGQALARVTAVPAQTIGMAGQIGTLAVGAWGDAVVLGLHEGAYDLWDCHKQVRQARQLLVPEVVIKGGRVYKGTRATVGHTHY
jgi:dihydroorotase